MKHVLVTGPGGFVGTVLCPMLTSAGYTVRAAVRAGTAAPAGAAEKVTIGNIDRRTDWTVALRGVELVVHLAARAHVSSASGRSASLYVETNAHGTGRLAEEAVRAGVRRLVYLSSIKVNGEETAGQPYSPADEPRPRDAYGCSKLQGEQLLAQHARNSGLQIAVVRSPLVYGPGVRANFLRLLQWIDRERWLPLGSIRNRRSLVSVWSLCDLLVRLLEHPRAAGGTWMVSDDSDLSTPELVRRIAGFMGRRARLLPVPESVLRFGGTLLGRGSQIRRLSRSLAVDISQTRSALGWAPLVPMDEGLRRTVAWYLGVPRRCREDHP